VKRKGAKGADNENCVVFLGSRQEKPWGSGKAGFHGLFSWLLVSLAALSDFEVPLWCQLEIIPRPPGKGLKRSPNRLWFTRQPLASSRLYQIIEEMGANTLTQ
jgi:hypothetical protein